MPVFDGLDAARRWHAERPARTRSVAVQDRARAALGISTLDGGGGEPGAPDDAASPSPDRDPNELDLEKLYRRLPARIRQMSPKDAYEWLRVLKLSHQLDADAADQISRDQAVRLLVERARVLRQTMLTIPRRVRHLIDDTAFAALSQEIRKALQVYAAPEGYLDQLLPEPTSEAS